MSVFVEERRLSLRMPAGGLRAHCIYGETEVPAEVLNLSVDGALLRSEETPPVGTVALVRVSTPFHGVIRATGKVVRRDSGSSEMGLHFHRLEESRANGLRRLLMDLAAFRRDVAGRMPWGRRLLLVGGACCSLTAAFLVALANGAGAPLSQNLMGAGAAGIGMLCVWLSFR